MSKVLRIAFIANLFLFPLITNGQAVYGELLGNGLAFYTVNYEHPIRETNSHIWSVRGGLGMYKIRDYDDDKEFIFKSFPIGITAYNRKDGNHHREIGLGLTYVEGLENNQQGWVIEEVQYSKSLMLSLHSGYRYQKPNGGFLFKIYYAPAILIKDFEKPPYNYSKHTFYWMVFGISMGYRFKNL